MSNHQLSSDDELVAQVREAVRTGAPPEALAATVGRKPTIDTTAGFPLAGLRRLDMTPDPQHPTETFEFDSARAVVYWVRDVPGANRHIVGVQARTDGTSAVFFAVVLP
jgi:hypothetical protein